MYSQLLHNYENVKDDYTLVRKRHDDLVASHSDAVSKLEHSQVSFFSVFFSKFGIFGLFCRFGYFGDFRNILAPFA